MRRLYPLISWNALIAPLVAALAGFGLMAGEVAMATAHDAGAVSTQALKAYALGVSAYNKKDLPTALRQLTIACNGGVAAGCDYLGGMYYNGFGVRQDMARSATLFAKGCNGGEETSCYNLGVQYHRGESVPQSYGRAIDYYRRALAIKPNYALPRAGLELAQQALAKDAASNAPARVQRVNNPGAAKAAYPIGIDALGKNDFPTALRQLTTACDGNVASGCFFLAGLYYQGKGVRQDRSRAVKIRARSCDLGDADGCDLTGRQYHNGDGVPQDIGRAITYYRRALAINPKHLTAPGALSLAVLSAAKARVADVQKAIKQEFDAGTAARDRRDYVTALRHYTTACNSKYGAGCFALGNAYETGEGVAVDKARAAKLYDQACTLRDAYGCSNLGALYHDGDGVPQSYERAISSYQRALAIEPDNDVALDNLALAQQRRALRGTNVKPASATAQQANNAGLTAYSRNDFATAIRQFTVACDARFGNGCYNLGVMVRDGEGIASDKARAATLFAAACKGGNANGCYNLGLFYDDGTGVTRNQTTAASYYVKACDAGKAGGCYNAGVAYDRGDGVNQSYDRAIGYYRRALVIDSKLAAAAKAIASAEQRRGAPR